VHLSEKRKDCKIYDAKILFEDHDLTTGMLICTKKEMKIAVENGYIQILSLQFPGKKKMTSSETESHFLLRRRSTNLNK
jgi:methionyl-tRNA formyltransferase